MRITNEKRELYWNNIQNMKNKLYNLALIFQNPVEIKNHDIEKWVAVKNDIVETLSIIEDDLKSNF